MCLHGILLNQLSTEETFTFTEAFMWKSRKRVENRNGDKRFPGRDFNENLSNMKLEYQLFDDDSVCEAC
jgi:hypothetical protein